MALQIHESVGHAIELDRILGWEAAYAGTSWLDLAQLGALQYGSELMNITIDPTIPGALGTFGYDDEGTPAAPRDAVRDGTWVGVLAGRDSAAVAGLDYAGSVRADGWARLPMVRMTNVGLEPGPHTLDEIIAATDDGIYMETNRSWSIDDKRLNFQFGTEVGYEVKDGQLGRLLRNPTYTGIGPQFWRSLDMLSSEIVAWGTPNCGKGQPGQTGHTGPSGRAGTLPQRPRGGAGVSDGRGPRPRRCWSGSWPRRPAPTSRSPSTTPPGAHPLRQLGDPPERRRGVRAASASASTSTAARRARRRRSSARTGSTASSSRVLAAAALAPLDAGLAGRRAAGPARRRRAPVDPATRDASPDDRATIVRRLRRRRRRAGDGRVLPDEPLARRRSPTRPARPSTAESADVGLAGIARRDGADGVARLASGRLADIDGSVLGARAAAKANAAADPVEIPPDRYEVVLEPTAVADILEAFSMYALQRQGRRRAALVRPPRRRPVRRRRSRSPTTRPAAGVAFDADGHADAARRPRRRRRDGRADPRSPHRGRGR